MFHFNFVRFIINLQSYNHLNQTTQSIYRENATTLSNLNNNNPNIQPVQRLIRYRPFIISLILSIVFLIAWSILFSKTLNYCMVTCLSYYNYFFSCEQYGFVYCCNNNLNYGQYQCGTYKDCVLDNTVCGVYRTWAWICGVLAIVYWILMIVASCRFRKMIQRQQQQQMGINNGYPYNNQNIIYPNNPNNYQYPNNYGNQNQYQNNANRAIPNQNPNPNPYVINQGQNPYANNQGFNQNQGYVPPASNNRLYNNNN